MVNKCDCQNPEPAEGCALVSNTCPIHNDPDTVEFYKKINEQHVLPCPFCGGRACVFDYADGGVYGDDFRWVACCENEDCRGSLPPKGYGVAKEEWAVEIWNKRAENKGRLVRYCSSCSSIGEVPQTALNCCPEHAEFYVPLTIAEQAKNGFKQSTIAALERSLSIAVETMKALERELAEANKRLETTCEQALRYNANCVELRERNKALAEALEAVRACLISRSRFRLPLKEGEIDLDINVWKQLHAALKPETIQGELK